MPAKDVNIVMGDLNAKVGCCNSSLEHIMGKHGVGEINENGERFQDFCAFNNLVIGGTNISSQKYTQDNMDLTRWKNREPD